MKPTIDYFATHAWRYHADWTKVAEMLERDDAAWWRNFSVPWYDPAFDPNTDLGRTHLHDWLESQIRPVHAVFYLASVHNIVSARKWLALEVKIARALGKPVFCLPDSEGRETDPEVRATVDQTLPWNAEKLRSAVLGLAAA